MEENGAAIAAVDTTAVSEAPQAPPEPSHASEPTARDAIERAFAAVDAKEAGTEPAKEGRKRNPDGTFTASEPAKATSDAVEQPQKPAKADEAPKPVTSALDAPKRFSEDAKTEWAKAPPAVQSEITRAIKELETGIAEHQARWEPLKPFEDLAKQHNTTIPKALENYIGIERLIARDPVAGLNQVCENMGISLRQVAEHILGKTPDQNANAQDATIRELRQHIAELKNEISGVTTTINTQKQDTLLAQVTEFAADKPRFEELADDVAYFLSTKRAKDLSEAYELAERLNPAPQPAAQAAPQQATAQPRPANLSLSGAPSSGSNPVNRKPPSSPRDALDRAFATMGI